MRQLKPREFPAAQLGEGHIGNRRGGRAAYPYHIQFSKADDQKFWFYNSMHFSPSPCPHSTW